MFKKFRNNKSSPLPTAPTLEEMFSDLDTFPAIGNIISSPPSDKQQSNSADTQTIESWWNEFQHFSDGLEKLVALNNNLETYKTKLDTTKGEIESDTNSIRNQIKTQLDLISDVKS